MKWLDGSRFSQDPHAPDFVQDPSALYRALHRHGRPAFWIEYGLWCLSGHAAVDAALRDRRFARLPPATSPPKCWPDHLDAFARLERWSLLALEPPQHTAVRRRVNGAFVAREVQRMTPAIQQLCHSLIDALPPSGPGETVDLLKTYATPVPVVTITGMLGVPEQAAARLLDWSHAMVRIYTGRQSLSEEHQANQAACDFDRFIRELLDERRSRRSDDLLGTLCTPDRNGEYLTDEQIVSIAVLLLNAGHEATVHQLGNAIHRLLCEPQWIGQLQQGTDAAAALVNEALRLDAPLHLFTRYAQETVDLDHGVTLAAGDQIALLLAAANTDPARYTDPYGFNPLREDAGHLSLGAGLHFCLGALLARAEIRIALQVLFERLPGLRLAGPARYQDNYHFHGLQQLLVQPR